MPQGKQKSVLLFAGLDPSGGAGLSADVATFNYHNLLSLPIVTTLTAQNTQTLTRKQTVSSQLISEQIKLLKTEITFDAIKLGLLGSPKQTLVIKEILKQNQNRVIVCDPIIRASSQKMLANNQLLNAMCDNIFPWVNIITPNVAEFAQLQAIKAPLPEWVLVSDGDSNQQTIKHRLYHQKKQVQSFFYQKLPHCYRGTGCTLASALTAYLLETNDVTKACQKALDYTYQTLVQATKINPHRHQVRHQLKSIKR